MEGNIRLATVLFGDVVGFTALSEDLSPEAVTEVMNRCFEVISEPIVRYEGTIDKYVGDAIMARFGAPQAHEDDPVRAISAALAMQRAIAAFGADVVAREDPSLKMRIGINTGEVMAGEVGSSVLKQFTLMGNTVNLASRLEHAADPGSVLVGETTYRLARHAFEFRALAPMEIRGQSGLVHAYVPLAPKTDKFRSNGGQAKFVGRETELALLERRLDNVRNGKAQLIAVVGEAGVGKSRFVNEFWRRHRDENLTRVQASASSLSRAAPYSLLAGFIRSLIFGDGEEREIDRTSLRDRLLLLLPESSVSDSLAALGDIVGVKGPMTTRVSVMETRSRQMMVVNVLKILLEVCSKQATLLVVLEDLHWADGASLDVLGKILVDIESQQVMVLMTQRMQFDAPWVDSSFYEYLGLSELPHATAQELVAAILDTREISHQVAQAVLDRSGGNPYFLEQLLSTLIESGVLVRRNGAWALSGASATPVLPETIQGIVQARIDQLPRKARTVLEIAAVIGMAVPQSILATVVGDLHDLEDDLKILRHHQFLVESRAVSDREYAFKHSLTRDVVYRGILASRRRTLHERVATALESLSGGMSGESVPLLAMHYAETSNREKALAYAISAAERARQLYANQDAVHYLRQALQLMDDKTDRDRKPSVLEALGDVYELLADFRLARDFYLQAREAQAEPRDQARLWRKLGDLAQAVGRYAEAAASYRQAEEAIISVDEPNERVDIWLARARMDRSRGAIDTAWSTYLQAISLVGRLDEATSAALYFELGGIERERGHLGSATGYLGAAAEIWERSGTLEKQALVAAALADVALHRGELKTSLVHFEKALDIHQRMLDRQGIASMLFALGRVRRTMGDLATATRYTAEAMDLAIEIEDRSLEADSRLQMGLIALERDLVDTGRSDIAEAYTAFKEIRNWRGAAQALIGRAAAFRARGDVDSARTDVRRGVGLASEMNDLWLQAEARIEAAELEDRAGDSEQAADHAQTALNATRDLGDPRLVALAEHVLGRVRLKQGRSSEAMSLLESSVSTLRRIGANLDAARAVLSYLSAAGRAPLPPGVDIANLAEFAQENFKNIQSGRGSETVRLPTRATTRYVAPSAETGPADST